MNVKLLTKEFFIKRGGEQLNELEDKTKVDSYIKLPKSVNDYMGDKGQTKNFKFSSVDDDMFDDKSGPSGHFAFSFNQPIGMKAMDEFYDEMLPSIDYSGELPEYYEYKLNKGKTTNDKIVEKLRENAINEDATLLPEAQELYPQFKTKKGEAFERFKAQFEKYKTEKIPITTIGGSEGGGEGKPPTIEVKPVKKFNRPSAEERQKILRAEKMDKLEDEINQIQSAEKIQKVFRGSKARRETKQTKNGLQSEPAKGKITDEHDENKLVTKNNESDEQINENPTKSSKKESHAQVQTPSTPPRPTKPKQENSTPIDATDLPPKMLVNSFIEARDEDAEELVQTPKKTPAQIKEKWLKKFEDADRAQRALNISMEYAHELETEIENLSKEKDFKKMKADEKIMKKYNALKEGDIINVKPSIGRKSVKLETILRNIKISSNLKALRKKQDEEENRRKDEREKDKDVRFGVPKTTIQTLARGGGGGGAEGVNISETSGKEKSKR